MFNLKLKNLKSKKGFSLVELMVVVAIMGTLASIAIPAFNEYRRSAKKNAYKADLTSLHKGWMAFGVELDSFCERETRPNRASITSVGMEPLFNSKLYGALAQADAQCNVPTGGSGCNFSNCDPTIDGHCSLSNCSCTDDGSGRDGPGSFVPYVRGGRAPGKENFIGFGDQNCGTGITLTNIEITDGTATDTDCVLNVTNYSLGVFGHVSGDTWHGFQMKNTGVVDERDGLLAAQFDDTCS